MYFAKSTKVLIKSSNIIKSKMNAAGHNVIKKGIQDEENGFSLHKSVQIYG
uniref:Uncharacterized protein n=1 Tax=Lepeophtheirus salmonis TaxID=72036 RepID=A0A0K2TDZ1_LEPSM